MFDILSNDEAMERTPRDGCEDGASHFILITGCISHQLAPEYTGQ